MVVLVALLLYAGILVAGLIFVHNPRCTTPILVAMAIQIPWVSSPLLLYQFSTGLKFVLSLSTPSQSDRFGLNSGFELYLGSTFKFDFAHDHPWGVGVNLVPLVLLIFLLKSRKAAESSVAESIPAEQESTPAPLS